MKNYLPKLTAGDYLTIAIGAVAGFVSFTIVFTLLELFSDKRRESIEEDFRMPVLVAAIIGCLVAGYTTATISTRIQLTKSVITGIVLLFIWLIVHNFSFPYNLEAEKISAFLILPASFLGGWWGLKRKQRKTQAPK